MKKLFIILPVLVLTGCVMSDAELKTAYADHYYQSPEYIAGYKQKISSMSANELAVTGAQEDKAKMNGQPRMKIDNSLYIENIEAKDNNVIYHYSLSPAWLKKSASSQKNDQINMQRDLIFRTCSLKTVQLAQEKGLAEIHQYYDDYPQHILFTLHANKALCKENGF